MSETRFTKASPHNPTTCPTCAPVMALAAYRRGVDEAQANAKAVRS